MRLQSCFAIKQWWVKQSFCEDQELMDLLDKFTDGGWHQWWRSFCEAFLDSI